MFRRVKKPEKKVGSQVPAVVRTEDSIFGDLLWCICGRGYEHRGENGGACDTCGRSLVNARPGPMSALSAGATNEHSEL